MPFWTVLFFCHMECGIRHVVYKLKRISNCPERKTAWRRQVTVVGPVCSFGESGPHVAGQPAAVKPLTGECRCRELDEAFGHISNTVRRGVRPRSDISADRACPHPSKPPKAFSGSEKDSGKE